MLIVEMWCNNEGQRNLTVGRPRKSQSVGVKKDKNRFDLFWQDAHVWNNQRMKTKRHSAKPDSLGKWPLNCVWCIIFICPIAIAQHGTDYKITYVLLSVCLSVCPRSYGHNFYLNLMKFCIEVGGPRSKNAFVRGQNPMTPSRMLQNAVTPHFAP